MDRDGQVIQLALYDKTGQRTVPNIFVQGNHIGGNSDLQSLHEQGKLRPMLHKIANAKVKDL